MNMNDTFEYETMADKLIIPNYIGLTFLALGLLTVVLNRYIFNTQGAFIASVIFISIGFFLLAVANLFFHPCGEPQFSDCQSRYGMMMNPGMRNNMPMNNMMRGNMGMNPMMGSTMGFPYNSMR
jgi:hypothetical protein